MADEVSPQQIPPSIRYATLVQGFQEVLKKTVEVIEDKQLVSHYFKDSAEIRKQIKELVTTIKDEADVRDCTISLVRNRLILSTSRATLRPSALNTTCKGS